MVQTTAIAKAILSFRDVEAKLNLRRSSDRHFFYEWEETLPELTTPEKRSLERLSNRYLHYLEEGEVNEGTLNIILLSPLLDALGLCNPPCRIRGEAWVEVQTVVDTKVVRQDRHEFALSQNFTLLSNEQSNLFRVLRILKYLVSISGADGRALT